MIKAGFSRLDITPPLGADLSGYFFRRAAKGVLDPLYLNTVAISEPNGETLLIMALDFIGITMDKNILIRRFISEQTGVKAENIVIAALHQHTAPLISDPEVKDTALRDEEYIRVLFRKLADGAVMAIDDMADTSMETAEGEVAEPIAFVRRYFVSDGSVQTNPPSKYTPVRRCAEADNTVRLIRFRREGKNDIAIINFSTHPDVVSGYYFSADWPGFARSYTERDIEGVSALFLTGCQGDSNHIDYFKPKDQRIKNGNTYDHSKYMGRMVADAVVKMWDSTVPCNEGTVFAEQTVVYNRTNLTDIDKYDHYKAWYEDYEAGRLPSEPHITELAYARRIVRLRVAPIFLPVPLSVFSFGGVTLVGFGGEAFTAYATAVREMLPGRFAISAVCANGYEGYYPTEEAFAQGGYEAKSSLFTPTLQREIISALEEIFKKRGLY
ncbi:MAG: hypothetical protein IJY04_07300 [Clostridia bacterium]|nr:hypothetical protein [Clostridia bacterium]